MKQTGRAHRAGRRGPLIPRGELAALERLGDFGDVSRLLILVGLAVPIGALAAAVALALLRLIGLCTNLFFFQRWSSEMVSPAGNHLGPLVVLVPVAGAVVIGLMARFGSERIRGHGIPEAIEAILINGSRLEPRVALLKPVSSAISIGSGGPFGAEGPIIMTGGAFGSLVAQLFHLSSAERRTLLVAGAAGGMSATFGAPLSAAVLGFELLLFEWRPRSFVPVALASATAAVVRRHLLGLPPLFATPPVPLALGTGTLLGCALAGLLAGALSALLTRSVYASEDGFARLPLHWMWWPAIGGLAIGLAGLWFPQALGVGYDVIGAELRGALPARTLAGVLLVKWAIWAVSLGSGTSGGVLAPLLMMGGALGGLEALVLPGGSPAFWALVSMGAILGGTMRSPLTGVIFALELTHDVHALLPLLIAVVAAHAFTVAVLERSILTEKVARRGFHVSREYSVDPLEVVFVREVMRSNVAAIRADLSRDDLLGRLHSGDADQRLYPVVDAEGRVTGVVTRSQLLSAIRRPPDGHPDLRLADLIHAQPEVAYPDETLRVVAHRMAASGLTSFPVVERGPVPRLRGMISLSDLLRGRTHLLEAELRRERVLHVRFPFLRRPGRRTDPAGPSAGPG